MPEQTHEEWVEGRYLKLGTPATLQSASPTLFTYLTIPAGNGSVRIHGSGRVELDKCELDEATLAFWKSVEVLGIARFEGSHSPDGCQPLRARMMKPSNPQLT